MAILCYVQFQQGYSRTKLEQASTKTVSDQRIMEVAKTLASTLNFKPGPTPAVAEGNSCWISESTWKNARVGWGRPTVNHLPQESMAIVVGGQLFSRGLYAHAPSTYSYELVGKWNRLSGKAGLADGNAGSVVFVILGDGKELWRSKKITEGSLTAFELDVTNVHELTFNVENAGDGNGSDWGIWLEPKLERK